jgi:hypothetical protein
MPWRNLPWFRRAHADTPAPPVPGAPEPRPPHPGSGLADPPEHSPGLAECHLQVAYAVLDVADSLSSIELCHRLATALRPLDGVTMVEPAVGSLFDPDLHVWDSSAPASTENAPETVAVTKVAGLVAADGTVWRKARVVVFD